MNRVLVRALGDIDTDIPSLSCNGHEFIYNYEPAIPFYVGTNGFFPYSILDNKTNCSTFLRTTKTNICTHKNSTHLECGVYPQINTQNINIQLYPTPRDAVRNHCEEPACGN